jgi:hypothetical protein
MGGLLEGLAMREKTQAEVDAIAEGEIDAAIADAFMVAVASIAADLWRGFNERERALVRFGMFPAEHMERAEREVQDAYPKARDLPWLLAVALMDCAKADGGMRA